MQKAIGEYQQIRSLKNIEWKETVKLPVTNEYATVNFLIRSTGRFAWAFPDTLMNPVHLEIIPSEIGNIPIKTKQLVAVYEKPNSVQCIQPVVSGPNDIRFVCNLDLKGLAYLACTDDQNRLFLLTGEQLKKLSIVPNSIQNLAFPEIPDSNFTEAEWLEYFHIKRKKK